MVQYGTIFILSLALFVILIALRESISEQVVAHWLTVPCSNRFPQHTQYRLHSMRETVMDNDSISRPSAASIRGGFLILRTLLSLDAQLVICFYHGHYYCIPMHIELHF